MIYNHVGGIKDPLKQDLALEFCRNQNKVIRTLTETHINHDQIHHIRNNWLRPIFFSLGENHSKGLLVLLCVSLECIAEVDLDPKERFGTFNAPLYNDRALCVYASSRYNTREQLLREYFFEELHNHMENKNQGNEHKIILGYLIVIQIKQTRIMTKKYTDFIDTVPICPAKNHRG